MSTPPGAAHTRVSMVHLTDKKVPDAVDRALVRRATAALAEVSGMQTKTARRLVIAYASGSRAISSDGWSTWLRNWFRGHADPTAVTAIRNVTAQRGD